MRPFLSVAEPALLDRIIDEARHILATAGMEIRGDVLRRRLLEAGLSVSADRRILFPLFDRNGHPHAEVGGDTVRFVPGSSGLKVQDHRTGGCRDLWQRTDGCAGWYQLGVRAGNA